MQMARFPSQKTLESKTDHSAVLELYMRFEYFLYKISMIA
jgi:hypothetical protein